MVHLTPLALRPEDGQFLAVRAQVLVSGWGEGGWSCPWCWGNKPAPWCLANVTLGELLGPWLRLQVWLLVCALRCPGGTQPVRLRVDDGGSVTGAPPPFLLGPGDTCLCPAQGPRREAHDLWFRRAETCPVLRVWCPELVICAPLVSFHL